MQIFKQFIFCFEKFFFCENYYIFNDFIYYLKYKLIIFGIDFFKISLKNIHAFCDYKNSFIVTSKIPTKVFLAF